MAISKAQQKATNKYIDKAYDRINLTVQKGQKQALKAHAEVRGESVNGFINRAILETMERDNGCISPSPAPQASAVTVSGQCPQPLTDTARKAAVEASEASGEELPVFVERAIITQAKRDKLGRSLGQTTKEAGE